MLVSQVEGKVCKYMTSFRACFILWGQIIFLYLGSNFCTRNSRYHSAGECQILEHTSYSRNKWGASHMNFQTTVCITYTCPGHIYMLHASVNLHKLFCIFNCIVMPNQCVKAQSFSKLLQDEWLCWIWDFSNIVWDRLSQYIGWYIIYNNPNL